MTGRWRPCSVVLGWLSVGGERRGGGLDVAEGAWGRERGLTSRGFDGCLRSYVLDAVGGCKRSSMGSRCVWRGRAGCP